MTHPKRPCQGGVGAGTGGVLDDADPSSAVLKQLKRIMHLNRQLLMRTMSDGGGHPAQAGCLRVIGVHDSITQRDLGVTLQVSPATLTTMLQRIERQGLIERWPDEQDQRLMRLRLTDEGRALNARLAEAHLRYIDATITPLAEEDRVELARLLGLLGDNFVAALETADEATSATEKDA